MDSKSKRLKELTKEIAACIKPGENKLVTFQALSKVIASFLVVDNPDNPIEGAQVVHDFIKLYAKQYKKKLQERNNESKD
jgi:hypothetical protein